MCAAPSAGGRNQVAWPDHQVQAWLWHHRGIARSTLGSLYRVLQARNPLVCPPTRRQQPFRPTQPCHTPDALMHTKHQPIHLHTLAAPPTTHQNDQVGIVGLASLRLHNQPLAVGSLLEARHAIPQVQLHALGAQVSMEGLHHLGVKGGHDLVVQGREREGCVEQLCWKRGMGCQNLDVLVMES